MVKLWSSFVGIIVLIMLCLGLFPKSVGAYFTTNASSTNNALSSGWWVPPSATVNSPNGGETLYQGNSYNITWTAAPSDPLATATIDLYYSTDGGTTYPNTITTGETNDGNYSWVVPAVISSSVKIKVVATDSHGLANNDESNTNFTIKSGIVMNEFLPNPAGADDAVIPNGEWVELYNNGSAAVDVNDWVLYDVDDTHELVVSASNTNTGATTVAAGGFLVVYRNGDGDFALNNTGGDTVRLYNNAIGSGGVLIDSYAYATDAANGKSYARIPDGTGPWIDPDPTPGNQNILTENYLFNLVTDEVIESTNSATESAAINNEGSHSSLVPQPESTPSVKIQTPAIISEPSPTPTPTDPIPAPTTELPPMLEAGITPVPSSVSSETSAPTPTPPMVILETLTPTSEQSNGSEIIPPPDLPQEGDS